MVRLKRSQPAMSLFGKNPADSEIPMEIFCIDIGNTHTHFGIIQNEAKTPPERIETSEIDDPKGELALKIQQFSRTQKSAAFAFCSVFPDATGRLEKLFAQLDLSNSLFQLTADARMEMKISYPKPKEIGQDRLSNAIAATACYPLPCIVIDLGTAVTFDIVTKSGGYEGGIIAPGIRIMTEYLHEQTALLPKISEDFSIRGAIGHSTRDAMKIGCLIGFGGMIEALVTAVTEELKQRGESKPTLLSTGGASRFLPKTLRNQIIDDPAITLRGLALAYRLNRC